MNKISAPVVLVMAGGTGGHVFPALATALELESRGYEICWLGTRAGLEAEVVPANGMNIEFVSAIGVRGKNLATLMKAPFVMFAGVLSAMKIIRKISPVSVLGMGGFVTVPGGIAAFLLGKPLVIHEQNAIAGSANKLLSLVARKIFCGFPGVFPKGEFIGNPLRAEISTLVGRKKTNSDERKKLLVLGGSLGALALNKLLPESLALFDESKRPVVRHQCGKQHVEITKARYKQFSVNAEIEPFIQDMAEAYMWADLVICRAGALTVAEISCAGLPAIFVPYPYAIDDHQTGNASISESAGAAIVMQQDKLDSQTLYQQLIRLLEQPDLLMNMGEKAKLLARPEAASVLANGCLEVACV